MIEINLSENEEGPLYRQLYRHIRSLIQAGTLKDGMRLPSIRSLRQQTRVSKTTIETAYHMLLEEGYIVSKARSGLFVTDPHLIPFSLPNQEASNHPDDNYRQSTAMPSRFLNKTIIDFNLLTIDGGSFPVQAWKSALTETLAEYGTTLHHYGDARGEYSLRFVLAQYLNNSRGVTSLPEQMIIGSGLSYSMHILNRLLEGRTTVAIEEDSIAQVGEIFVQNGFRIIPVSLRNHEWTAAILARENIQSVYVTPSHRPIGNPLPYSTRQQLLLWAKKHNAYIIEDDYDGEFRYSGRTIPSLQGMDQDGVVIYLGTFSKAFSPALRMNYMVLPVPLMAKLDTAQRILSSPSRIDQLAMKSFIERGHWYRHLRRMRNRYRKKHERLTELLAQYLTGYVQIEGASGGLHIELTLSAVCSVQQLIDLAAAEGVLVYGSQYEHSNQNEENQKIYLGFGSISETDMERGVQLLKEAWAAVLK